MIQAEALDTLVVKSIEKKNYDDVLVKVSIPSNLDKALLGRQFMKYYEESYKTLSGLHGQLKLLAGKTNLVEAVDQNHEPQFSSKLSQIVEVQAIEIPQE